MSHECGKHPRAGCSGCYYEREVEARGRRITDSQPSTYGDALETALPRVEGQVQMVAVRVVMPAPEWDAVRRFADVHQRGTPPDEAFREAAAAGIRASLAGPEHEHSFQRDRSRDAVVCDCGVAISGEMIAALGWNIGKDVRRANELSDRAGKLATEVADLKVENCDLRRKLERLEQKK